MTREGRTTAGNIGKVGGQVACESDVTKATVVSGTRPATRRRSKDHWYEPSDLDGSGKVVGSFAVPL